MDKLEITCLIFEAIKQNWIKNGSFQSLVEIICQRLDIPLDNQFYDRLIKANALWLNNHLEEPSEEETEEENIEINNAKPVIKNTICEPVTQAHTQTKNHDFH
jgi:flagellar biosynthesis component FlhA